MSIQKIKDKIKDWEAAKSQVGEWKTAGETIVFTNGCFDLLHYGHLYYLAEAKALGNKLIIGLNSNKSVQRLKGKHRPINDNLTRSHLLASLEFIDMVVFFEEDTPSNLITLLLPEVLVKGGDYKAESIVGYDIVTQNGGKVNILSFIEGYSTTNIEKKIKGE
ncbi:MAG: rfaE bifunctional protein nucleotidyltransferase chain/domain [Maribacter sp.]|jgi:rfaE bifunctional protein nucleotidyltransferase chain/domain